jgi:hypothetical protein
MLSTSDRIFLEASIARPMWQRIVFWCLPVVWVAMAIGNLYVAGKLGGAVGLTLGDAVALWYNVPAGTDVPPLVVRALIHIEKAFGEILLGVVFVGFPVIAEMRRRRDKRLATILKDSGAC